MQLVRELFPSGTADPVIAKVGEEKQKIVVTWDKDFKVLTSRIPRGSKARFRRLSLIAFRCKETNGLARITELIETVEYEYERAQKRGQKQLIIEIGDSYFRVGR